jgi:hypothetical protein
MNLPNTAGGRSGDLNQIRKQIDGDDGFFSGHHVRTACGAKGKQIGSRGRKTPVWTKTDTGIQQVLLRAFPKLIENPAQREKAARWARVIYLYYRMGYTFSQVAEEMSIHSPSEKRPYRAIERLIERIKRVGEGKETHRGKNKRGRRGRPSKIAG